MSEQQVLCVETRDWTEQWGTPYLLGALDNIAKIQHILSSHELHAVSSKVTVLTLSCAWLAARSIPGTHCDAAEWTPALSRLSANR